MTSMWGGIAGEVSQGKGDMSSEKVREQQA
jgi:hypothetical protein